MKNGTDEPICKAEVKTQMQRISIITKWEKGGCGELRDWY